MSNINGKAFKCDVSDFNQIKKVVQSIKKNKINITGIINEAGIASMNLALTTPPDITEKIIKVIFQCGGDLSSSGVKPFRSSGLRSHGSPADIRGRRLAV